MRDAETVIPTEAGASLERDRDGPQRGSSAELRRMAQFCVSGPKARVVEGSRRPASAGLPANSRICANWL